MAWLSERNLSEICPAQPCRFALPPCLPIWGRWFPMPGSPATTTTSPTSRPENAIEAAKPAWGNGQAWACGFQCPFGPGHVCVKHDTFLNTNRTLGCCFGVGARRGRRFVTCLLGNRPCLLRVFSVCWRDGFFAARHRALQRENRLADACAVWDASWVACSTLSKTKQNLKSLEVAAALKYPLVVYSGLPKCQHPSGL